MAPSLIVHIGTHKTGSSAIQAAFTRYPLPSEVLYPQAGRISTGGHLNLAWEAIGDRRHRPERGRTIDLIAEVLGSPGLRMVVLSAETFSTPPGDPVVADWVSEVASAIGATDIQVIGYVRPQWDYLESHYTQMVKTGVTGLTLESFIEHEQGRPLFDYPLVFRPWLERYGSALVVRPYVADVVVDLFTSIGLRPPDMGAERVNSRPGLRELEMLRALREDLGDELAKEEASRLFKTASEWLSNAYPEDQPFHGLDDGLVQSIYERFEDSNRHLAELYWAGEMHESFRRPDGGERPRTWSLSDASPSEKATFEALRRDMRDNLMSSGTGSTAPG